MGPEDAGWRAHLSEAFASAAFDELTLALKARRCANAVIYPPEEEIFAAFDLTPFEDVRIVILGQDPYHGPQQAMGLAFSVPEGVKPPPSLRNIFKEIAEDTGESIFARGDLTAWARQGVFLLNTSLTVEQGKAGAHAGFGWNVITDAAIKALSDDGKHLVFMLWGNHAQKKRELIDDARHLVLCAPHPSPLSAHRGFLGCRHFSQANAWLRRHGFDPVVW